MVNFLLYGLSFGKVPVAWKKRVASNRRCAVFVEMLLYELVSKETGQLYYSYFVQGKNQKKVTRYQCHLASSNNAVSMTQPHLHLDVQHFPAKRTLMHHYYCSHGYQTHEPTTGEDRKCH